MRLRLIIVAVFMAAIWPHPVQADTTTIPTIELSELLPDPVAPLTDEHDEFTELHNTTAATIDLTGYKIKVGTHVYQFTGASLDADDYLTVTAADSTLSLSNSGATVQLLAPDGSVADTTIYTAAKAGWSWAKIDNVWDWTNQVTPAEANEATIIATPTPTPTAGLGAGAAPTPASASPSPLLITELLPDPASPLSDDHDEYIELLNPSSAPIDLTGYTLKTGKSLTSHFALSGNIAAGGYSVWTSSQTHLQLSNAGSSVALFDPAGSQVDATVTYGAATTGATWARFTDGWSWTVSATPGADNVFTAIPVKTTATKAVAAKTTKTSSKAAASKASTTKKLTTKAAAAVKTAAVKTSQVAKAVTQGSGLWLLLLLAGLTIGFVIYEFRHDVIDLFYRARNYWKRRRQASN